MLNNILKKYRMHEINADELKGVLGNDLYNIEIDKAEVVSAEDVINSIKKYLSGSISLSQLVDWVNIVWFTELYEYKKEEENSIASVMALLETIDEAGISFTEKQYMQMIEALIKNEEIVL